MQIAFKVLATNYLNPVLVIWKKNGGSRTAIADAISRSLRALRNERSLFDLGISETKDPANLSN